MTHDGGVSWTAVKSNQRPSTAIHFISERQGWTWDPDGLLRETEDDGRTWSAINPQIVGP